MNGLTGEIWGKCRSGVLGKRIDASDTRRWGRSQAIDGDKPLMEIRGGLGVLDRRSQNHRPGTRIDPALRAPKDSNTQLKVFMGSIGPGDSNAPAISTAEYFDRDRQGAAARAGRASLCSLRQGFMSWNRIRQRWKGTSRSCRRLQSCRRLFGKRRVYG